MKYSIISTVYNKEKFLDNHITSLISLPNQNIEFILVNDGSLDKSLEILQKYAKKDKRIKIIDQKNQGPSTARKNGFKAATGDYIWFIDSDDHLFDNNVINQIDAILEEKEVPLIIFSLVNSYENKDAIDKIFYSVNLKTGIYAIKDISKSSFRANMASKIFKRKLIDESFFIDTRNFEDIYFTYRYMAIIDEFYYLDSPLYVVNRKEENSGSLTATVNYKGIEEKYKIFDILFTELEKNPLIEAVNVLYLKSYLDSLKYSLKIKNKKDKMKYLEMLKELVNETKFDKKYLYNKHYKKIYKRKKLYENYHTNIIISFFNKVVKKSKKLINPRRK